MITFRNCDRRWPFLWESVDQPTMRWHRSGEGPVQYLADTPDGAWAEFLRHEEITDEVDLDGVSRALWAVSIDEPSVATPALDMTVLTGDLTTYPACQAEAGRLRAAGAVALRAPSAALKPGTAGGHRVETGLREGTPADGHVYVLFGPRFEATGWMIVDRGRPPAEVLPMVNPL